MVDNAYTAYADGTDVGSGEDWNTVGNINVLTSTTVFAVEAHNFNTVSNDNVPILYIYSHITSKHMLPNPD